MKINELPAAYCPDCIRFLGRAINGARILCQHCGKFGTAGGVLTLRASVKAPTAKPKKKAGK